MAKLVWDQIGQRLYENGTNKGVVYLTENTGAYGAGVAWNGLQSVKQTPDGAEATDLYADNLKYLSLTSAENFKGSIDAYTYPDEFAEADGSVEIVPGATVGQQNRRMFGLTYQTRIGNDIQGTDYGYKIHLIWGAKVAPSERGYETINQDPAALTFSWEFTTIPVDVEGYKPIAYLCLDSTKLAPAILEQIETMLYGTEAEEAKLPTPQEVIEILTAGANLPTGVSFDKTTASVAVGDTVKLTPTVVPANADDKTVTYTSGTPSVATVGADGTVTGVSAGTSVITGSTVNGKKATATVTVTNP